MSDIKNPLLSLCMIVKNEARFISDCLESVNNVVDEIIVIDTGSQDDTPVIAREFGAKIFHYSWDEKFAAARNYSLNQAKGEWILVLDADETLDQQSAEEIKPLLNTTPADGIRLKIRNFLADEELERYHQFYLTRLFRNKPQYRYQGSIHEQILPVIEREGGKIISTDLLIYHYGYAEQTVQGAVNRTDRNFKLLLNALNIEPHNPYLYYHLGLTYKGQRKFKEAREALLKAIKLDMNILSKEIREKLYTSLAQIELAFDDLRLAQEYAQRSLNLNSHNVIALYVNSLAQVFAADFKNALEGFRKIKENSQANLKNLPELGKIINYCQQRLKQ